MHSLLVLVTSSYTLLISTTTYIKQSVLKSHLLNNHPSFEYTIPEADVVQLVLMAMVLGDLSLEGQGDELKSSLTREMEKYLFIWGLFTSSEILSFCVASSSLCIN